MVDVLSIVHYLQNLDINNTVLDIKIKILISCMMEDIKFSQDIKKILVIDAGMHTSRFGFAGENLPRLIEPSIIGYPRVLENQDEIKGLKDYYIGEEVEKFRKKLKIYWIFEYGIINWASYEYFLKTICNERLKLDLKDISILITRDPHFPDEDLEKITEIMFETLGISSLCIYLAQALSLYQLGKNSGLIIDIGYQGTKFVPFLQNKFIRQGVVSMPIAGRDVIEYLRRLLTQKGYTSLYSTDKRYIVKDIMEKYCQVSLDPENDYKLVKKNEFPTKKYSIADLEINLGVELFFAPECFFNPLAIGKESRNITENIIYSIALCNDFSRFDSNAGISKEFFSNKAVLEKALTKELFSNIILTGGGSLISGLKERLIKEFERIVPKDFKFNIYNPELRYSSWLGGSQFASKSTPKRIWLNRDEYKKEGSSLIHKHVQNDLI